MPLTGPIHEGGTFLLSPLRSTLFRHAFAAIQDRQQYRKMCGLPDDHEQVGFNQGPDLQAHSSS